MEQHLGPPCGSNPRALRYTVLSGESNPLHIERAYIRNNLHNKRTLLRNRLQRQGTSPSPTVGFEPTTTRLRALRSTD
uniref:Uncharacterized protein n=1 Tax=Cucumis melo TaxID=3656 RepID=A0A9I9CNG2_CUCME